MTETLFPYQAIGAEWLSRKRMALLADEMGLGKSAQAIAACDIVKANRILVLAPACARINWLREFKRFSTFERKFSVIFSSKDEIPDSNSIICSYDLATKIHKNFKGTFDALILDEVHFLKSTEAQRTRAVWGKEGLVRRAKRIWALSGTPSSGHPGDLWTMLYSFGATKLKYDEYVDRFCTYYIAPRGNRQITGAKVKAIPELRRLLAPYILRRKKDEVMKELPPIYFANLVVEPSPVDLEMEMSFAQWFFPEDKTTQLFEKIESERKLLEDLYEKLGHTAAGLKALEAVAKSVSTIRRYIGLQKVQAIVDLVTQELTNNAYQKIVIFAIHRDVIEGLRLKLSKFKAVTLYGGTDPETRQRNVDKFQHNPKCRVFIGNVKAAGTAITLTAAHNIIFIESSWVVGDNMQAAMRCHRIGQTKPVYVRIAELADSLDEKIGYTLKRKAKEFALTWDKDRLQEMQRDATNLEEIESSEVDEECPARDER